MATISVLKMVTRISKAITLTGCDPRRICAGSYKISSVRA